MKISRTSAMTMLVAIAVTVSSAGVAQAVDPDAPVNAIADDIANVAPEVAIAESVDLGDVVLASSDGAVVTVPSDPSLPVEIISTTADTPDMSVTLPEVGATDLPRIADDGTIVYTTDAAATVAVQPLEDGGVRLLTVLDDVSAPSVYDYTFDGASFELLPDGSITVSHGGEETGTISAPWAYDANGVSVPTRYSLSGGTLTQIVDHTAGDYAYPITADPAWYWWPLTTGTCVAQIAPFVTPFAAAKAAQLMVKAQKIVDKSAKLKAAVNSLGGLKSALGKIKTYVVNKGKGLSANQVAAIKAIYVLGLENLADALGIGACYSLVREIAT